MSDSKSLPPSPLPTEGGAQAHPAGQALSPPPGPRPEGGGDWSPPPPGGGGREGVPVSARAGAGGPSAEVLLEAAGLHTFYGVSHILHGVDFSVRKGETIGLMGRNGMGKTTLLKTMLGLVRPREGSVKVRGQEMTQAATHAIARRGIAYVPEGRGIFPNLSVRENLVMAARAGVDGRREWTFDRVIHTFPRLGERLSNGGAQLSGGEQQMLTIGRALMTNPDLLILDEATEGLAPLIAREIWSIIKTIRASGIATVIVDKNYAAVMALADRSVVLVKGRVVFSGASGELSDNEELMHRFLGV